MTKEELLQRIKEVKETNSTELILQNKELTELPKEILQLTNLRALILNGNQLSKLPQEIIYLTSLHELHLDDNQLSELPKEIMQLSNLQMLSLDNNRLSKLPEEIMYLSKLQILYLTGNQMSELPKVITRLSGLRALYFGANGLNKLPKEITRLTNLEMLSLNNNQLNELPKEITQLVDLRMLSLKDNQLSELSQEIGKLSNLQELYLDNNQLTKLPPEITQLINLRELSLSYNRLTKLPPKITQLSNLQELSLNDNQLNELPKEIAQLTNLQILFLNSNQLTKLPPEITQLTDLQLLSLNDNELSELPEGIAQLTNLRMLYLNNNRLSKLPLELTQLTNLQTLFLNGNKLSELPPEIAQMTNLRTLYLEGNQINELPPEITQLTTLRMILLGEDQLKSWADDLIKLKDVSLIIRHNDEFGFYEIGREVLARVNSGKELLDYYSLLKGETRELNEAKILIVGQGSVGKTSLIKRLITGGYNPAENKTDGIDIYKEWKVSVNDREVQLNVWDFGGQEIMHATHQFFLTKRSIYVLVLDSRIKDEENRVDYWLEKIKILGGDSPIMVVGNKIDQHQLDINQTELKRKYPNIVDFYPVSCATQKNIGKLKTDLIAEISKLGGIHEALPASWFAVKKELEEMDVDYISFEKYIEICKKNGVVEPEHQKRLIGLLHDLGIALNFSEDVRMQDTNVLNPEWVTQGVYKIINSRELFKAKGVLERKMLNNILDTRIYPTTKQIFVIDMMKKFELCFDITPDKTYLVPDLLSAEELNTGDWTDSLKFEYHYPIYFNSIFTRFIVKMHEKISKTTYWRTGVVLEYKSGEVVLNEALVKADTAAKKVLIFIRGNEQTRREFLYGIRDKFEDIHYTFSKEFAEEGVAEKLPIPTNPKYQVDYKHLLRMEADGKGEEFIYPEGMTEKFKVKDLLRGIRSDKELKEKGLNTVAVKAQNIPPGNLTDKKAELEPIKSKIDGKVDMVWLIVKVLITIPVIIGLGYILKFISDNWEKINTNLQSAQIVWGAVIAIVIVLFLWIIGGKEKLGTIFTRLGQLREEAMRTIAYKWADFEIAEYKDICKELDKEAPKELIERK